MPRFALYLLTLAAISLSTPPTVLATNAVYPPRSVGYDISYPECETALPQAPQSFAIIGVNGGRGFYQNPCLNIEYAWAESAPTPPSFYLNVNAPVGKAAFEARSGPLGFCRMGEDLCLSYNFGFRSAQLAYADAGSQQARAAMWWLDVETTNSWSENLAANARVIQGAIDSLRQQGMSVGIYSTPDQWQQIAGSYRPGLPVWVAGASDAAAAAQFCSADHAFGGGIVWLVQYPSGDFDGDYACPTAASAITPLTAAASGFEPTPAQYQGATVSLPVGWNLIALPPGTTVGGLESPLSTLQPGDAQYETSALTDGTTFGYGYWAYFPHGTMISLASGRNTSYTVIAAAGAPVLVGNPSGLTAATVSGADLVLTYDPLNGYQQVTTLPPGRGAWAYSFAGGTIAVTPLPAPTGT